MRRARSCAIQPQRANPGRRLVRLRVLAASDAAQDLDFFALVIWWNEDGHRLADDLLRAVTQHFVETTIAGGDDAVEINADDGVVRRLREARSLCEPEHCTEHGRQQLWSKQTSMVMLDVDGFLRQRSFPTWDYSEAKALVEKHGVKR